MGEVAGLSISSRSLSKKKSFGCFSPSGRSSIISEMAEGTAAGGDFFDSVISDSVSETNASESASDTKHCEEDARDFCSRPSLSGCSKSQGNDSRCLLSFKVHSGGICTMAMSDKLLYTGSEDGTIGAFRLADLKEMDRFGGWNNGSVKSILVTSSEVFSAHQDHKIRSWSSKSSSHHKLLATLPRVKDFVSHAVLQRNNYVKIRRHRKSPWNQHFDTISCMAMDDQAGIFFSGSWDRSLKVWRIKDNKCLESVDAHTDAINAVAVSDRGVLFSGSADSSVKVWLRKQKLKSSRKGGKLCLVEDLQQPAPVNCVALWKNWMYAGCSDGRITAWMVVTDLGEEEEDDQEAEAEARVYAEGFGALVGHSMSVLSVSAAGDVVCSGSADRSIRVWRRNEEDEEGEIRHSCICVLQEIHCRCPVKSVMISVEILDGCLVYSGGLDGSVKVWWVSLVSSSSSGCGSNKPRIMESPCSVLDYRPC